MNTTRTQNLGYVFAHMSLEALDAFEAAIISERKRRRPVEPTDTPAPPAPRPITADVERRRSTVLPPPNAARTASSYPGSYSLQVKDAPAAEQTGPNLSETQWAAVRRLVLAGVERVPRDKDSREQLRWYRTMGSLATRGYAMQDGDQFFPTRYSKVLLGHVSQPPSAIPPKRRASGTVRRAG